MGSKILVVDDEPAARRVLKEILRLEGYEIAEAADGDAAWQLVQEFQPNLVLLDVELAGADGLEVCQRLKQQPATAHLPVALISGKALKGRDKAAGLAAGADEYFTKPVDAEEFPARIRMLLRLAETTAALRASERDHREAVKKLATLGHAVESSAEMICITDLEDRFTFVNSAFLKAYGYTKDELLGKTPGMLFSGSNPPGLIQKILRETRQGGWQGEVIDRRKDGTEIPIFLSTSQIKDSNGQVLGLMGVARDITEQKKTERRDSALAGLSFRLSSISTPTEAALVIMDAAGDLFAWDAGYLHLYSVREDKLIPVFTADTIDGQRREVPPTSFTLEPSPLMREVMTQGAKLINRTPGSAPTAGLITFGNTAKLSGSMMYVPVHFGAAVWGILSVQSYTPNLYSMPDLTLLQALANHCGSALRRIEIAEALRRSERNLRLIAENTTDVIFAFDMDREPIYVNPAVEQLTGYTFAEIKARKFVNWIHPQDQARMLALWEALFQGRAYSEVDFRLVTKSGQMKWCSSTWGPMFDEIGQQIGVQGRERDITETKQLERQVLEVSADERRRVGHELHDGLGQYLAGIAFKAKALEEMLARHESAHADKAHELVGLVSSAISQARDLARGLDPVEVETIGFGAALQNLCADTRKMFNVQCEFVPAQFPDVNPQTGLALYRIVQQAIHNACTHGRARAIRIELGVNNGEVVLAIRDDGRGFDSSRKFSTGMGLRVMRYRARSVGGDLTVYSEPGAGAEVRCTVPKIRS